MREWLWPGVSGPIGVGVQCTAVVNPRCPMEGSNAPGSLANLLNHCNMMLARYKFRLDCLLSSPRGALAFHELRRYHTRPLRLNWGPENVHFGKTHFWDPNINVRIFLNGPKNGPKFKKCQKITKTILPLLEDPI